MMTPFLNPTFIISILIAISVHEWAHAYTAYRLGDSTAKYAGRMTLNPISHLDPIGAIVFLFVGFGWAKPVPVDPRHFKHPKRDNAVVAFAGPLSNLVLATIAFIGIVILSPGSTEASAAALLHLSTKGAVLKVLLLQILASSLFVNLALMAFNLLPIGPLDGSKIVGMFVSYRHELEYQRFLQYGPFILLFLLFFDSLLPIPLLSTWVFGITNSVLTLMGFFAGGL